MNILFLSLQFPFPNDTGEKLRTYNLIKEISQYHNVYLLSFINEQFESNNITVMKKWCKCIHTISFKRKSKIEHIPNIIKTIISGKPPDVSFYIQKEMKRKLIDILNTSNIDIVQIEHSLISAYAEVIKDQVKILDFPDVEYVRFKNMVTMEKSIFTKIRYYINYLFLKKWEPKYSEIFDMCFVTSRIEKEHLLLMNSKLNVIIVPNGVDSNTLNILPPPKNMNKILFIGSLNYPPNIDAIRYFYRNVYPSILKISTTIAMIVVGSNPTSEAEEYLNKNNICHYFNVKDVRNIYEECAVSVVPIRYGGGTRLKILESMALGRPVVSTPLGCEGIDVKHGENILIAKSSAEYASQIIELINDNSKWELIRNNGRKLVEEYYEWNKIALNVNKMYEKIMKKRISQII